MWQERNPQPEDERLKREQPEKTPEPAPEKEYDNFDVAWAVRCDGHLFRSPHELFRYRKLKLLQQKGLIKDLEVEREFDLVVNDIRVAIYRCDFFYKLKDGTPVVEEVKGNIIEKEFVIKWRLLKALYTKKGYRFRLLRFGRYEIHI